MFFELREVPGLKKKPSTSELLDWLKLLLAEDIPPEALRSQDKKTIIPPLHGALLKNEQDVHLFERVVFMVASWAIVPRFIEPVTLKGEHGSLEPLDLSHAPALAQRGARRRAVAALVHRRAHARGCRGVRQDGARLARAARARCRSSIRDKRRARSSAARATSTSTPPIAGSRSATPGTRSACSARRSTPSASSCCSRTHSRRSRCIAVEFRTHWFNHASRAAIARLGRQAGRRAAQSRDHRRRRHARHRRVLDHRQRVAGGAPAPRLPARKTSLVIRDVPHYKVWHHFQPGL